MEGPKYDVGIDGIPFENIAVLTNPVEASNVWDYGELQVYERTL